MDMYYLEDEEMARQLVELGYRGDGEILRREEFDARKEAAFIAAQQRANKKPKKLASAGRTSTENLSSRRWRRERRRCGTAS